MEIAMCRLTLLQSLIMFILVTNAVAGELPTPASSSELSYEAYINSTKPIKCLYGYAAEKVGDHDAAIAIFEDCIERFNSVYAMIWLAQIYDTGVGVPRDEAKATALMRRGALTDDEAGYSALAKYHYGVALIEGKGTTTDREAGISWLTKASLAGVEEASEYLAGIEH